MKIKKILFVITTLEVGGAEIQLRTICNKLIEDNVDVCIINLSKDIKVLNKQELGNMKVISLCMQKNMTSFIQSISKAKKIINEFNPDIIHSHLFHAIIFSRFLKIFYKKLVHISSSHNFDEFEGSNLKKIIYKLTNNLSDYMTNVGVKSVLNYEQLGVVKKNQMNVAYNGIDTEVYKKNYLKGKALRKSLFINDNSIVVTAIGRNHYQKDYPNLLQAISLIPKSYNLVLLLVGKDVHKLEDMAKKMQIYNRVKFLGIRKDIVDILSATDIYTLSSRWEGFPLVIGEAMSCELPVITTSSGSSEEWLGDKDFVVDIEDSADLSKKLINLIKMSDLERKNIGKKNREKVLSMYSSKVITKNWIQIYENLLDQS